MYHHDSPDSTAPLHPSRIRLALLLVAAAFMPRAALAAQAGEPLYHPLTVVLNSADVFDGSSTGAWGSTDPNPFLHCRLDVYFDHASVSQPIRVPGYFAGDGSGGQVGNVWRAHFLPTVEGEWTWFAVLEGETNLNARPVGASGTSLDLRIDMGSFIVGPVDPRAPGFRAIGEIQWGSSDDYWRASEASYGRFVQAGVGSPENFLGYAGFSGASDGGSGNGAQCCCKEHCYDDCVPIMCATTNDPAPNFLHRYQPHIGDWNDGDPDWSANGMPNQGRGIIGALNYLGDVARVNSIYTMVMNLGGDGKDTHPFWTDGGGMDCPMANGNHDPSHTLNYHVERLDQWRTVLQHANDKGLMVQILLAEQEACNIRWFGPHDPFGAVRNHDSIYRRLFLKQMVAHFAHLPALRWNLCEENKPVSSCLDLSSCTTPGTVFSPQFTAAELDDMGRWIRLWDPYDHPIGVHTPPGDLRTYEELLRLPQFPNWLTATSIQVHSEVGEGVIYEHAVRTADDLFAEAGHNVPIVNDEQGSPWLGLASQYHTNAEPTATADDRRKRVLYDVLLSGGQISYYFGYYTLSNGGGDLRVEDFRTRHDALRQLGFAARLMRTLAIWEMEEADDLITGQPYPSPWGPPECASTEDKSRIVIYYSQLRNGTTGNIRTGRIDLTGVTGDYDVTWISPTTFRVLDRLGPLAGGARPLVPIPDIDGNGVAGDAIDGDTDLLVVLTRR